MRLRRQSIVCAEFEAVRRDAMDQVRAQHRLLS